jgi:hypothetical protein
MSLIAAKPMSSTVEAAIEHAPPQNRSLKQEQGPLRAAYLF